MLSIESLIAGYREKRFQPSDVCEDILRNIESSKLNAFISYDAEQVARDAACADEKLDSGAAVGPLHGIPVAVKDLFDVAGTITTMASEQYATHATAHDAASVARLREAGAIIIGKTNAHEFAYGSTGDRSYFGPVHNPVDPARITGGSSSGSAAALAADLCAAALGSDTSASIRLPAALCGVVGLKPTFDLLPRDGVFALSPSLDHVGPMSTTVSDNALLLDVLAGAANAASYSQRIGTSIKGLKVGVLTGFYDDYLEQPIREAIAEAAGVFEAAGATVASVEVPNVQGIYDAQQLIIKVEAYAEHRQALLQGKPFQQEVRDRLLTGKDANDADYRQALSERSLAQRAFDETLSRFDVLLCATCGITAPLLDERRTKIDDREYSTFWLLTRLTAPTNFSGHPSLSVPFRADGKGLPIGLQLIGSQFGEATLYQFASVLEAAARRGV